MSAASIPAVPPSSKVGSSTGGAPYTYRFGETLLKFLKYPLRAPREMVALQVAAVRLLSLLPQASGDASLRMPIIIELSKLGAALNAREEEPDVDERGQIVFPGDYKPAIDSARVALQGQKSTHVYPKIPGIVRSHELFESIVGDLRDDPGLAEQLQNARKSSEEATIARQAFWLVEQELCEKARQQFERNEMEEFENTVKALFGIGKAIANLTLRFDLSSV